MDLDDLLDQSAPPVSQRTTELQNDLNDLVLTTEAVARPRRGRRIAAVSLVAIATAGFGTTAAGITPMPSWMPFVTSAQTHCEVSYVVEPSSPGNGEPQSWDFPEAEAAHAAKVATAFLAQFDYAGIDKDAAIRRLQATEEAIIAAQSDPAERQPRSTGSHLEVQAVSWQVWTELRDHLESQGISPDAVQFNYRSRCDG